MKGQAVVTVEGLRLWRFPDTNVPVQLSIEHQEVAIGTFTVLTRCSCGGTVQTHNSLCCIHTHKEGQIDGCISL